MNLFPVYSFLLQGRPTFMNLLRGEKTIQTVATCVKYSLNSMKNPRRYVSLMSCSLLADQPSRIQGGFDKVQEKKLIWEGYKRNYKGSVPPEKTRLRCKRRAGRKHIVGNPCPICKNDIEIDYKNAQLLRQFICPHTGKILPATKTGLCRLQQKKLEAAINQAWDHGLIIFTLPREPLYSTNDMDQSSPLPSWNKIELLED